MLLPTGKRCSLCAFVAAVFVSFCVSLFDRSLFIPIINGVKFPPFREKPVQLVCFHLIFSISEGDRLYCSPSLSLSLYPKLDIEKFHSEMSDKRLVNNAFDLNQ